LEQKQTLSPDFPDATVLDGGDEWVYRREKLQLLGSEENAQRSGQ